MQGATSGWVPSPVVRRSIKPLTWRKCCTWLHSLGIYVSRSPPTLLRTLRTGAPYQELVHRISVTFWVRNHMAGISDSHVLFTMLQAFFQTDLVERVIGCTRLDVPALVEGRATDHLELLAFFHEIHQEVTAHRAFNEAVRDGVYSTPQQGVDFRHRF